MKRKIIEHVLESEPLAPFSKTLSKWCMEKRKTKDALGLSNEYIAEKTGISLTTVGRIIAGNVDKDIRWSTVAAMDWLLPTQTAGISTEAVATLASTFQTEMEKVRADKDEIIRIQKEEIERLRKICDRLLEK